MLPSRARFSILCTQAAGDLDGADEAFAGYRRHRFQMQGERLRRLIPASVRQPLFGALGRVIWILVTVGA